MIDLRKLDLRRRQLGMSRAALARRAKVSVPTVQRILTGKEPAPSLATLEAIVSALGLALKVVEELDVEDLRERQAKEKARKLVGMVQANMGLEAQAVDEKNLEQLTRRNVARLLAGPGKRLWDE